jgi:hypothetical protein
MTQLLIHLKIYIKDLYNRRERLQKELNEFTESDWGESSEPDKIDAQIELLDEIIPELERIC